jgi:hypothetical protein
MQNDILFPPEEQPKRYLISLKGVVQLLLYVTGISSLGYICSILTFYFHARSIVGHFPTYGYPDPKELHIYDAYDKFISPAFGIWVICFLSWILLTICYVVISKKNLTTKHILFSAAGHMVAILITLSQIFEWYVD